MHAVPGQSIPAQQLAISSISPQRSELNEIINSIPYKRLLLWGLVIGFCFQMRDFFGIAMGTFIISFIGNSFCNSAQEFGPLLSIKDPETRRRVSVLVFFAMIVALVTLFGVMTIPDIAREGADFVQRLRSDNIWVLLVEKARAGLGDQIMENLERVFVLATSKDIIAAAADHGTGWTAERSQALGMAVSTMLKGYTTTAATVTAALLKSVTKFALQIGISLVLSFMMVWDWTGIVAGVRRLRYSRLGAIYDELSPMLVVFGKLFGRALEAQAKIALVNTALTAIGMSLLAIPGIGLLSLFVFICSFIPIAGCIISTVPIGFVALTEYGFFQLALVIVMVILVHFVEGYILNPAIYSAHLKLHPLMVLSVLVVAEHNMGIWGLLLAVPLSVFALDVLLKYPDDPLPEEVEASEKVAAVAATPAAGPPASTAPKYREGLSDLAPDRGPASGIGLRQPA